MNINIKALNISAADIEREIKKMQSEMASKLYDEVKNLEDILVAATPIDTGHLRSSYSVVRLGEKSLLRNSASYADKILLVGQEEGGRGSSQLPDGIIPIIYQWKAQLEQ